jgi:hypothetical protein
MDHFNTVAVLGLLCGEGDVSLDWGRMLLDMDHSNTGGVLGLQSEEGGVSLDSLWESAGAALMRTSAQVLTPAVAPQMNYDGTLEELGQLLAETMGVFGINHLSSLTTQDTRLTFLQQVTFPAYSRACMHKTMLTHVERKRERDTRQEQSA